MKKQLSKFLIMAFVLSIFLVPVKVVLAKTNDKQNQIKKFSNIAEFKKFIENNSSLNNYNSGIYLPQLSVMKTMSDSASAEMAPRPADAPESPVTGASSADFSQTNVQTSGVDEADIVKTDGRYIYSVSQNDLFIVDTLDAAATKLVATINFKNQPQNIYIDKNKLVVIGYDYNFRPLAAKMSFVPQAAFTFVKVFDVSDKTKPRELRSLRLEGNYSNSRVIDGYVYLITNAYGYTIDNEPLPRIYEGEQLINSAKTTKRYIMPNIYYFDMPYQNLNLTTVAAVSLKDDTQAIKTEIYALPGNETVYASTKALYIAYSKYLDQAQLMMNITKETLWPKLPGLDKSKIVKIEAVDDFILNSDEKLQKSNQIINRYLRSLPETEQAAINKQIETAVRNRLLSMLDKLQQTVIHKITISGADLKYAGFAEVPGRVVNQFALDEDNGYLRVATTRDAAANFIYLPGLSDKRSNGVYVMNSQMKMVGRLEGLALNEQIYAARFMQNRVYLSTFEQIDPLFVIDLSVPSAPKVLGELKIPGFSQYLHPYNNNTLISVGRATELLDGRAVNKGLKVALFDVSKPSAPKQITELILGGAGSDSSALYDHKAFLFSAAKNLLVIPATLTKQYSTNWGDLDFNGALVFAVSEKSLSLRGQISHVEDISKNNYQDGVKRALYIGNKLFTISDNMIKLNALDTLSEINKLQLRKELDYKIIN